MTERMAREIGARRGAQMFYKANHLICDLQKGELFCFPNSSHVFEYLGKGWYKSTAFPDRRKCRTGTFTACFPQPAINPTA